jgi:ABC-type bacteriocin/lantibiotic exporter with double-glycine peptidase domain
MKKQDLELITGRIKDAIAMSLGNRTVCLDVPYLMQVDGHSCGFCSALMIARFYSVRIPQVDIQQFAHASRDGTGTRQMVEFLRRRKLSVRVYEDGEARVATILGALGTDIPVIVSVRPRHPHYLVIIGVDAEFFYVNDPSPHRNLSGCV